MKNKCTFVVSLLLAGSTAYAGETWHATTMQEEFPAEWSAYLRRIAEANEAVRVAEERAQQVLLAAGEVIKKEGTKESIEESK
jgi:hypothetical protein